MESQKDSHRIRVLLDEQTIGRRVLDLARQIDADFAGSEDLVAIAVLKGSVFFFTDLVKRLETPLRIDFFQTTSYGSGTTAGEIRIKRDIDLSIRGKDVILVEDIIDTGWTLRTILDLFRFRGARSVKLCALLDKHEAREVEVEIDYCGFRIGREFVVGYGLDFNERYRNLPYIGVVEMNTQ